MLYAMGFLSPPAEAEASTRPPGKDKAPSAFAAKGYTTPNPKGTLKVHVTSCKGLKVADVADGTSDPYVIVKLPGGATKHTKTIEKTLNPKFDETLEFQISELEALLSAGGGGGLTLAVWDKNFFRDVALGEVVVPLDALLKRQSAPLKKTAKLDTQGSVSFSFQFVEAVAGDLNA